MLDLIQIGAHIGGEIIPNLIEEGFIDTAWLFEPIPDLKKCCEERHSKNQGVRIFEQAIVTDDSTECIIYLPKEAEQKECWWNQLGSLDKSHVVKHGYSSNEIDEYKVEALDASLLPDTKHIFIDAEGSDLDILVKYLDSREHRPYKIHFEHAHIDPDYINILRGYGYSVRRLGDIESVASLI